MQNKSWVIKAFIITFIVSLGISGIVTVIANNSNVIISSIITIIVVVLGIIFDIIGTSVLTANEATFHAKASNKISGAKESIKLIKNSSNIANFCNDIVGDVCGIVAGSMATTIAISIAVNFSIDKVIVSLLISAILSSVTVGGKALGKGIAVKYSDNIIGIVGSIINKFKRK